MHSLSINTALFILLATWTLIWKGWSMWVAARNEKKLWFIVLLLTSTLGILDMIYIFFIAKEHTKNDKEGVIVETETKKEEVIN